jgi:hypothetical protein
VCGVLPQLFGCLGLHETPTHPSYQEFFYGIEDYKKENDQHRSLCHFGPITQDCSASLQNRKTEG